MLPGSKITVKPKQITSRCRVPHAKDDVESLHRCLDGHLGKRIPLHIPGAGRTPCFVDTNLCPHPPSLQNVFFPAFYVYQSHVSRVFSKNSSPLDFPRFPRKSLQNTFGFGALVEIPKIFLFCRDPLFVDIYR